jgi:hypothetical protein
MNCSLRSTQTALARVAGILVAFLLAGCASMSAADNKFYTLPETCDFAGLEGGDEISNACSPRLIDRNYRGIVINGPIEIVWPKGAEPDRNPSPFGTTKGPARLIIAATYKLPEPTLGSNEDFNNEILFVAVNKITESVYSGKIPRFGTTQKPDLGFPIDNNPNRYAKGYINPDLVNILSLPITNATYTVYATLGEYKSNVLTIKTIVK